MKELILLNMKMTKPTKRKKKLEKILFIKKEDSKKI